MAERISPKTSHPKERKDTKHIVPWDKLEVGGVYDFYSLIPRGIAKFTGPLSHVGPVFNILQHETEKSLEGKKAIIMPQQVFFKHHSRPKTPTSPRGTHGGGKTRRVHRSTKRGQTRRA